MPKKPRPNPVHDHARGLATIAEAVIVTSPSNPVAQDDLVLTHLPGSGGTLIYADERATPVLHVDSHGHVLDYAPDRRQGGWEARLVQLVTCPPSPPPSVQITLDLVTQALLDAAAFAQETQQLDRRRNPLEQLGMASLQAAMALRIPLMP